MQLPSEIKFIKEDFDQNEICLWILIVYLILVKSFLNEIDRFCIGLLISNLLIIYKNIK